MTLKLALVGLGKIARDQHLPAIAATPGIELAAICSRNASLPGLPCFETLDALLAAGLPIDAVALCTPPQGRHALAATALAAGKHVMLEKPPGATISEIAPLAARAAERGRTLFATWHSRFAPAVEPLRALLAQRPPTAIRIDWKEDVRVWHPGQAWIFEPGGLGVFDPGINALSILTRILPHPPFVTAATLDIPANKQAPIAAEITLQDPAGLPIAAHFDFRQTGEQTWSIHVDTGPGPLTLEAGGKRLRDGDRLLLDEPEREYPALYARFVHLCATASSDVDLAPLALVADAFLLGHHRPVAPFHD